MPQTLVRTHPWPEIIEFYRSIPWAGAMADLGDEGVLRIEPAIDGPPPRVTAFRFEFAETQWVGERWRHTYAPDQALAAFERFLDRAHWFVEYRPAR